MADLPPPVPPKRRSSSPAVNKNCPDHSLCDISLSPHGKHVTSTPKYGPPTRRFTAHTMLDPGSAAEQAERGGAVARQQLVFGGSVFQRSMTIGDEREGSNLRSESRFTNRSGFHRDSGYCDESPVKDKDSPTKDSSQRNSFCSVSSGGNGSIPRADSFSESMTESITSSQFIDGMDRIMDGIPEGDGEDGEDLIQMINEIKERSLLPMKEDLADWVSKCLEVDICQDELLDRISNGVLLGKLANFIKSTCSDGTGDVKLTPAAATPDIPGVKFQERAKDGSFHARDNASNFINWARAIGVPTACLFESECLVLQKKPRNVLISLYEVARIASRLGVEPPGLVKLDREIEAEEQGQLKCGVERRRSFQSKIPVSVKRRASIASVGSGSRSGSGGSGGSNTPRTQMKRSSSQVSIVSIDNEVQKMSGTCRCDERFKIMKECEGKYDIGGKTVFIRVLGGRHVMVRVGGGWDTLEHYLTKHDPCRVLKFSRVRRSSRPSLPDLKEEFMLMKGRYKATALSKKS